jgi:hypothetical protein
MAASGGHTEIIKYLQSPTSCHMKCPDNRSITLSLTLTSHPLDCRYLIISVCPPCDVSVKDKVIDLLSEALHMAASGGHTEIIKYLQSKGCDVSVKEL